MTWDPETHARRTDPPVSSQAAAQYAPKAGTDMAELLAWIKLYPQHTCGEIFEQMLDGFFGKRGIRQYHAGIIYNLARRIGKRASDLEARGLIRFLEPRKCRVTGTPARPMEAV